MLDFDFDTASGISGKALEKMLANGIPATPENYHLWFLYETGQNPDLNSTLDGMLGAGMKKSAYEQLKKDHLGSSAADASAGEATVGLQEEVEKVLARLAHAGEDAAQFSASLDTFQQASAAAGQPAGAHVATMDAETAAMIERTKQLEAQLEQSRSEVNILKEDLVSAQDEAKTDRLTNIGNRKAFDDYLAHQTDMARKTNSKLSLVIGDVDFFKKFNDTWGHQMGDHVLKFVALSLDQHVGEQGLAARYGGEEFALVLPSAEKKSAEVLANKVREFVSRKRLQRRSTGESVGNVTLSFGVAQYRPGEKVEALIERADQALYTAKETGRNKVVSA